MNDFAQSYNEAYFNSILVVKRVMIGLRDGNVSCLCYSCSESVVSLGCLSFSKLDSRSR